MDKKALEKEYSKNDEEKKPIIKQIYDFVRANWLPFLFALIIALLTIIVVPIVYNIGKVDDTGKTKNLSWAIEAKTVVNQSTFLVDQDRNSFGSIYSIKFDVDYQNLFILDKTKNRLLKYSSFLSNEDTMFLDGKLEIFLGYLNGTSGNDPTSLNNPNDVFIDQLNRIFVADTANHRIQLIADDKTQTRTVCGLTGQSGSDLTHLNQPKSVTMGNDNSTLYIADYGNNRIISCNIDNQELKLIIPSNATNRNQYIDTPISIKYDSASNTLVIAQEKGYNVVRWNFTTGNWALIAGSASSQLSGTSRTLFNDVCYVEIDSKTNPLKPNTFVADCKNERIQYYQGDLTKGRTIAGVIQASGNTSSLFNNPVAITFDEQMNLFVADSDNCRVQKFRQLG